MMKWLTSSSVQYARWLAMEARNEISKAPLLGVNVLALITFLHDLRWTYSCML